MFLVSELTNNVVKSPLKHDATVDAIRKIEVPNGSSVDIVADSKQSNQENNPIFALVKSKRLLLTSIIMWFTW